MKNKLRLPSRKRTVQFREPTVQDSIDLAKVNPAFEQQAVSWWLNTLQEGPKQVPAEEMTQEDRMVALLLTFFMTQESTTRSVSYDCRHCGGNHSFDADYGKLATQGIEEKESIPTVDLLGGEYTMRPLDGAALEEIEQIRLGDATIQEDQMRILIISKRISFPVEEIAKLPLKKYVALLKDMDEKLPELFHGIDFTTTHNCPVGGEESQISLPFQVTDFLPRI